MAYTDYLDTVQKVYIAYYQRPADPAGLIFWAKYLDSVGGNLKAIIDAFATSAEASALYGAINASTIGSVIDSIYQALFNRQPDAAGKKFYEDGFKAGKFTAGSIVLDILNGASGSDAVAISNKLQVANHFTKALDPELDGIGPFTATYSGDTDAQNARNMLKGVTQDMATVKTESQVKEFIKSDIADTTDPIQNEPTGQTFTLTTDIDIITGTSGDDTFIGDPFTVQAGDQINGGAGTDTLKLYGTATLPTISSIENIYVNGSTADVNLASQADAVSLIIDNIDVDVPTSPKYTLAATQSLTLQNVIDGDDGNNDGVEVMAAASVTAQTLKLNKVGDTAAGGFDVNIDINGTGVATLNVEGTGSASRVSIENTGKAIRTLNISGDAAVEIQSNAIVNNVGALATTIAITNTAGVTVTSSAATNTTAGLTITAVGGKDTVTLGQAAGANALTNKTSVDLGAGDDKLVISKLTAASNIQDGASFKGGDGTDTLKLFYGDVIDATTGKLFSGFEVVDIGGAQAGTLNLAHLSANNTISKLLLSAANTGAVTVSNLPEAATVEFGAAHGAALTINQKDSGAGSPDDSITLNWNSKTAIGAATGALTVADIETVNVNVTSTGTNITHQITSLVVNNATKVTVNASTAAVDIKSGFDATSMVLFDASASAKNVKVALDDAYAATAGVGIKGGDGDDTIDLTGATTGATSGTDLDFIITGGKGADDITLPAIGGGKDVIVYTAQTDSTYNKYDTITNFDATATSFQDFIDLKAFGFTGNQQGVKVVTTGVSLDAASAVIVAAGSQTNFFVDTGVARGVAVWDSGADVFVFVDANKDGNFSNDGDLVIKLAGVANATDITGADLIFA